MKSKILIILLLIPAIIFGQKLSKVNKYAVGIEIDIGHSFPNFNKDQDRWIGTFYPTGGLNVLFSNRINQRLICDLGVGITGYSLTNRGRVDTYVLDFASPTFSSGLSYNIQKSRDFEQFVKLTGGIQLGYQGSFVDDFETYQVEIQGKHKLYPFIRPEIGIRKYFKQKMKRSRFRMAYEFGTYFRYNLNSLGTAKIVENDFEVTLEPSGNIIGGYFKILFPAGKKRTSIKPPIAKKLPPIIYNPRFLE